MKKNRIKKKSKEEIYLRRYLSVAPIALSLWRAVEAKHFGKINLQKPILDIGCGFGEFAGVFFESQVEVGVDIDYKELINAMKGNKYMSLSRADARNLPFANESFSSVVSISTLEHIVGPDKVFKEAYRVLKPGGIFALTVVTDKLNNATFYGPMLKRMGFKKLGDGYLRAYDKIFHHYSMLSKKQWEKYLADAGFKMEVSREIISPKVAKLFDILLITAWPSQVMKLIFGKRMVYRPKLILELCTKIFLGLVQEEEKEGTNLFMIAKKPRE